MLRAAIAKVVDGEVLTAREMAGCMQTVLRGEASSAQIAALAVALRMRGEAAVEIAAAARVLRERAEGVPLAVSGALLDTCGTGGDGLGTFNISTATAIVAAACGVAVAKHGNRAVSSRAGSADVLEALGVSIDRSPGQVKRCIERLHIGFLFAPAHHGALRHAAPVRRELGLRTFFNLLGPLANPAGATHQLVGVYAADRITLMAEVLGLLGGTRAWVVHGQGGLDEVSPLGVTRVASLEGGEIAEFEVTPADFGLECAQPEELAGGDAAENAEILRRVLSGESGGKRTAVLMNAAAALVVAGAAEAPAEGARLAAEAIDSGAAIAKLDAWVEATR